MHELVLTLLSLTLSGSLVALLLFALKPLIRRHLSRSWQYYIWLVVLARLLLPIGPQDSLMQMVGERISSPAESAAAVDDLEYTDPQITSSSDLRIEPAGEAPLVGPEGAPGPVGGRRGLLFSLSPAGLAGAVWLGVAAVLLLHRLFTYHRLIREIKHSAAPCEEAVVLQIIASLCRELQIALQPAVYVNDFVPSPMLVGAFRPFIVLPDNSSDRSDLHYVLRHELVHFKRRDVFFKWVAQFAVYVHWFNPIVYLVQREIGHSCELACDEEVLRVMKGEQKSSYGEAILSVIQPAGTKAYAAVSLSMSEDKRQLKERLISIMGYQKKRWWVAGLAAMLTVMLLCGATYAGSYTAPRKQSETGSLTGAQALASPISVDLNTASIMGNTWYLIDNEEQLRGLGSGKYPLDGKYLLNANITLDKSVDWIPIGKQEAPFTGTFNGNGYEVINLTITDTSVNVIGMFAYAENADIYNVTLRSPDIESAFQPGNSIGPVLVLGKNCNSHDNQILDPVEREDIRTAGASSTGYTKRVESLLQDFAPYASYGVIYDPVSDSASYHGEMVKIFAVFKPYSSVETIYSFDFFYHDRDADSSLYLEAVRDTDGNILEIRRLDDTLAEDLLRDLEGAHTSQDDSSKKASDSKHGFDGLTNPYNFDATFNWMNRGISATDKFEPNSTVTSWISDCSRQQGAYILVAESSGSDTTYYVYYNGGGRYPWMVNVEGDQLVVELYSDNHLVSDEGYHLMSIAVTQGYSYSEIKLLLDGVQLPITSQ